MAQSRLNQHVRQQSIKSMLLAIAGIIVILALVISFGPQLLINFSLLVKNSSDAKSVTKDEVTYVAPPVLNALPDATKDSKIDISGYAEEKQKIKLYVNGKLVGTKEVNKDKQFTFSQVALQKGSNEIKTKAIDEDNNESNYSEIAIIAYVAEPPTIDVSFPQDGQTISKDNRAITVRGKTNEGVKVTVNDFWAITKDDGSFSYSLSLQDGDNTIKIKATDAAGNETTKEVKVKIE